MSKVIKVTTDNRITVIDVDLMDIRSIQRAVGGYIETVHTKRMADYFKKPVLMLVDEEGLLKGLPMNTTGSLLYGTAFHGHPIVGDILFVLAAGEDFAAPDTDELKEWKERLERDYWLKEDIPCLI